MNDIVKYEFDKGIATLTLDDGKANAMSVTMIDRFNAALDKAESDKAVVVIRGRKGMFCGGFDLKAFNADKDQLLEMVQSGAQLAQRVYMFPRPVIVACTGHAVAFGAFLLLAGDIRVGVDAEFRFQVNEVKIGMSVPRFAVEICRQRLMPSHLSRAVLTAELYTSQQALSAGFLDQMVTPEDFDTVVNQRATEMLALDAESFMETKRRLRQQQPDRLSQAVADDIVHWKKIYSGHDA